MLRCGVGERRGGVAAVRPRGRVALWPRGRVAARPHRRSAVRSRGRVSALQPRSQVRPDIRGARRPGRTACASLKQISPRASMADEQIAPTVSARSSRAPHTPHPVRHCLAGAFRRKRPAVRGARRPGRTACASHDQIIPHASRADEQSGPTRSAHSSRASAHTTNSPIAGRRCASRRCEPK